MSGNQEEAALPRDSAAFTGVDKRQRERETKSGMESITPWLDHHGTLAYKSVQIPEV